MTIVAHVPDVGIRVDEAKLSTRDLHIARTKRHIAALQELSPKAWVRVCFAEDGVDALPGFYLLIRTKDIEVSPETLVRIRQCIRMRSWSNWGTNCSQYRTFECRFATTYVPSRFIPVTPGGIGNQRDVIFPCCVLSHVIEIKQI